MFICQNNFVPLFEQLNSMQTLPSISIIVPIYGVEKYIAQFADSLLSQSYPHLQFVFVNDGTKDLSMDILQRKIEEDYPHLRPQIVIVNKENGGLPAARRTGLEHATGDYIYNVDPDDWLAEGALEKMAQKIAETGCDLLYFGMVKVYAKRKSYKRQPVYTEQQREKFVWDIYNHHAAGSLCNKCIKRTLFEEHTIYTPRYSHAEDCFVTTQIVGYATKIAYLDEMLYFYRKDNPAAMSRNAIRRRKREYALNFLHLYEMYRDVPAEQNPVAVIFDDILMQAGWYSIFYGLGLFEQFPYLKDGVLRAKIHSGTDVPIVAQLFTKFVARCK